MPTNQPVICWGYPSVRWSIPPSTQRTHPIPNPTYSTTVHYCRGAFIEDGAFPGTDMESRDHHTFLAEHQQHYANIRLLKPLNKVSQGTWSGYEKKAHCTLHRAWSEAKQSYAHIWTQCLKRKLQASSHASVILAPWWEHNFVLTNTSCYSYHATQRCLFFQLCPDWLV